LLSALTYSSPGTSISGGIVDISSDVNKINVGTPFFCLVRSFCPISQT
jgi:hypothetical protein